MLYLIVGSFRSTSFLFFCTESSETDFADVRHLRLILRNKFFHVFKEFLKESHNELLKGFRRFSEGFQEVFLKKSSKTILGEMPGANFGKIAGKISEAIPKEAKAGNLQNKSV